MSRALVGLFAVLSFLTVTPHADAVLIIVDFRVSSGEAPGGLDPVNTFPSTTTGSFSFDSSLIPVGGGLVSNSSGLGASSISFSWDGTLWTTANADLYYLNFAPDGTLTDWGLGGDPLGIGSVSRFVFDDFTLHGLPGGQAGFAYSTENSPAMGVFETPPYFSSWSVVPEPGTFSLLGPGLAVAGMLVRRRAKGEKVL